MGHTLALLGFFGILAVVGLAIAILIVALKDHNESIGGIIMLNSNIYDITTTNIIGIGYIANEDDEANAAFILPSDYTLRNLFVNLAFSPGEGSTRVFTVRINGSDTPLFTSISNNQTTASNTTNTVAALAGDSVSVRVIDNGTNPPNDSTVEVSFQYS